MSYHGSHGSNGRRSTRPRGTTYGPRSTDAHPYSTRASTYGGVTVRERSGPQFEGQWSPGPRGGHSRRKKYFRYLAIGTAICVVVGLLGGGVTYASTNLPAFP